LLLAGCAATPLILPRTPSQLDATSVLGTWHVGASTFPMWLDGTRTSPTFTYSELVRRDGRVTMRDVVSYQRHGQADGSNEARDALGEMNGHGSAPCHSGFGLGHWRLWTRTGPPYALNRLGVLSTRPPGQ
jgi:hypothetical protein